MDAYKVDFHIHTNYSDGQATPVEIVKKAKELEYDMIAITDHDGIDGINEALIAGETAGVKVVPGIELATETEEGIGLHILGYYFDHKDLKLNAKLTELRETFYLLDYQLIMKGYNSGTAKWKRLIEQGMRKGHELLSPL